GFGWVTRYIGRTVFRCSRNLRGPDAARGRMPKSADGKETCGSVGPVRVQAANHVALGKARRGPWRGPLRFLEARPLPAVLQGPGSSKVARDLRASPPLASSVCRLP